MSSSALIKLNQFFQENFNLPNEEILILTEKWIHRKRIKRKEFLIEKGKTEDKLYFVLSGTLRIFYENQLNEICVGFGYQNTLLCAYPSFVKNLPTQYYIQALKNCELLYISKKHFFEALSNSINLERMWHAAIQEALLGKIERELEMLTFTPTERVNRLLKRSPHVFQLIPKKYIASYLGMTAETLSRIQLGERLDP